jgi:thiol:disulfide interchange protein DsbA
MKIKAIFLSIMLSALGTTVHAGEFQGLTEGSDYLKYKTMQTAVEVTKDKPTFVELFWYGCPHCYHVKDETFKLSQKYKSKINYARYPVGFPNWESGGRMFFAYQEMKILDKMHDKTFDTIHKNRINILDSKNNRDAFLKTNGIDIKKFDSVYSSFGTSSKWAKAQQITLQNKIEGSPVFLIYSGDYTYQVSPAQAGGYDKALANLDKILAAKTK